MPNPRFDFNSTAVAADYFSVVSFTGFEAISKLYRFEIELKAPVQEPAQATFLDDVLAAEAGFIMEYDGVEYPVYGMLASFEELQTAANHTYYRAVLVPRLWQLTLVRDSRVYTDPDTDADATGLTVLDILTPILDEYQLDYAIGDVTGTLRSKTYRCQFNESGFDFISRLLEDEGIYYYFDHSEGSDRIIFSDSEAGDGFSADSSLIYDANPPANKVYESVNAWLCRKQRMPGNVALEGYDFKNPSDDVSAEYNVRATNLEQQYSFGDNITIDEADTLAQVRAEEIAVMDTQYFGESGVCGLRAGYTFDMTGHRNTLYNDVGAYVITEIHHEGQSPEGLAAASRLTGIQRRMAGQGQSETGGKSQYTNSFTAINSEVQFRPQRSTPRPRFYGTITAFVYSADDGEYAYVNENGHYRVTLPFRRLLDDATERATHWIRMAQPYHGIRDGVSEGMFYPLMSGTEVLLTFINGDPDRPIISATVPNASAPSLVKIDSSQDNSHQTVFSTHGMYKEDIRGGLTSIAGVKSTGDRGTDRGNTSADMTEFAVLNEANGSSTGQTLDEESGEFLVTRRYGIEYSFIDCTVFSYGGNYVRSFNFGCNYEENHESYEDDGGVISTENFDMNAKMQALGTHQGVDYSGWAEANNGFVSKTWGDTCEYQFGNSYNWGEGNGPGGAPCAYNYGNSYTENLLEVSSGTAETNSLNDSHDSYSRFGIDATKSSIEKTFGDTYSYQNGKSAEVHVGNSESETYGDSKETVHGNADTKVMGATSDMFLGAKNEMNLNAANSMTLGLENTLFIGGKIDTTLAAVVEFSAGVKMSGNGASEFDIKVVDGKLALVRSDATTTELEAKVSKLGAVTSDIKTCATKINSLISELDTKTISIQTNGLTMIS